MELQVQLEGLAPIILHNGQTSDPANKFSLAMKQISSKRKKVESDYTELSKLEFFAGLYLNQEKQVIVPASCLQAVIIAGAKKHKEGPAAKAGVFVLDNEAILEYGEKLTPEQLWEKRDVYALVARAKIGQSAIMRTRPIFKNWKINFRVFLNEDLVSKSSFSDWITTAGIQCGLCDWRPQHGRFTAKVA